MKQFLQKIGRSNILVSLIFAIVGILLMTQTDTVIKLIAYILGGAFIVLGISKTINYFMIKDNNGLYNYELMYGIIAIIIGAIIIFYNGAIEFMFRIMIGIWIIYSGVLRLSLSTKIRGASSKMWILSLILAILMIICGLYMTFTPGALVATIGAIVLVYSIMDLIESFIFMKNIDDIF